MAGGGDSGAPAFLLGADGYLLVGEITLSGDADSGTISGRFGSYFGGMLLAPYASYLETATDGAIDLVSPVAVPEPASLLLLGLGFAGLGWSRRRR